MTLEIVLLAIPVVKMKQIVIMMANARKVTNAELIIAGVLLALNLFMIAATVKKKIFALLIVLVEKIRVIVILTMFAREIWYVD